VTENTATNVHVCCFLPYGHTARSNSI